MPDPYDVPIGATGLSLNALFTAFAIYRLVKRIRSGKAAVSQSLYENKDGHATEESEKAYYDATPTITISLLIALGLLTSLGLAVLVAAQEQITTFTSTVIGLSWGFFVGWILVAFQSIVTLQERDPDRRHALTANVATSLFLQAVVVAVTSGNLTFGSQVQDASVALSIVEIVLAFTLFLIFIGLPTRPDVYEPGGKLVDRQESVSILSRYTYNWARPVMKICSIKASTLDLPDIPGLSKHTRSTDLAEEWSQLALNDSVPLMLRILWSKRRSFFIQQSLGALAAFLGFAPQLSLWRLLRALESHQDESGPISEEIWLWVVLFGASGFFSTFVESRVNWITWANVAIPARAQLSALIFRKAMRRKDVREPPAKENKEEDDAKKDDKDEKKASTDQDTINLLAIDTVEIHNFLYFSVMYISIVVKFVISITFLVKVIGWQSLAAGLATNALILPCNTYLSSRYGKLTKEIMKARDRRTQVLREALNGIRQIKFSALEDEWEKRVNAVRDDELKILWQLYITDSFMNLSWSAGPPFLAAASLGVYSLLHHQLSPSVAFTSIGVFMSLESAISVLPELISITVAVMVSCERIDSFLKSPEREVTTYPSKTVSFDNVTVAFPSNKEEAESDRFTLKNITLDFPAGELSVISGKTGSGKSLLLAAILGEVDVLAGNIYVPKAPAERYDEKATADNWIIPESIAYVSQVPWIENASIKDNILFGLPFDEKRYNQVLEAAALTKDLEQFEDGDLTEVGAQGISLSGGQRWRLTLARALYSRAGVLVMDDLFSALDAHVGKEIYEKGLTGELSKGRTRILVTHHVSLCLSATKYSVRLANGTIEYAGSVERLKETGDLTEILKSEADAEAVDKTEEIAQAEIEALPETGGTQQSHTSNGESSNGPANGSTENGNGSTKDLKEARKPKKLIKDEKREEGSIKAVTYLRYIQASGGLILWSFIMLAYLSSQALTLSRSWWVKLWSSNYQEESLTASHLVYSYAPQLRLMHPSPTENATVFFAEDAQSHDVAYYLSIYVIISLAFVILGTARYLFVYIVGLRASKVIFRGMTFHVLRMPLRWIDTVPLGRILNRFTADTTVMDTRLTHELSMLGAQGFELIGVLVAGVIVSPYIILLAVIMLLSCGWIASVYLGGAREIKRLESTTKSPIFELFGSSLKGVTTIRAFDKSPEFIKRMSTVIDKHTTAWWHNWLFNRWIGFYLALVGNTFSVAVAAVVVALNHKDAALAGFALSFAIGYTNACIMAIRVYASTQISMNATERVLEYTDLTTETLTGEEVPASWPSEGKIEVKNLVVSYAPDLPQILKGLTFSVEKMERIGVVGRTGAGKSTLSLALFRFLEAQEGQILVDGIDISKIKLKDLRTRLAVIPQDPVLFSGTIRSNLDPFDHYSDEELKQALQSVHLVSSPESTPPPELADGTAPETPTEDENTNIFRSLTSPISDGGQNISQGQRQLLCLAREIVSRPKIMILDEATSAVDMATDKLIQRSIREEFANTTLLVIAHRLSTVADFDKILVMGDGKAVEYGSPKELLELGGVFAGMVESSGETEKLKEIIIHGQTQD